MAALNNIMTFSLQQEKKKKTLCISQLTPLPSHCCKNNFPKPVPFPTLQVSSGQPQHTWGHQLCTHWQVPASPAAKEQRGRCAVPAAACPAGLLLWQGTGNPAQVPNPGFTSAHPNSSADPACSRQWHIGLPVLVKESWAASSQAEDNEHY